MDDAEDYWNGDVPTTCQISTRIITNQFVDGRIPGERSWALMHPDSFRRGGGQFGDGLGHLYAKQPDGKWRKIEV
jgi:hypothetical protein